MKRRASSPEEGPPRKRVKLNEDPVGRLEEILSQLDQFNETDLQALPLSLLESILQKGDLLLSLKIHQTTRQIPKEIWAQIMIASIPHHENELTLDHAAFFITFGEVCQSWLKLSRELFPILFFNLKHDSNEVLMRIPEIEYLDLSEQPVITNRSISKLTNLTYLDLGSTNPYAIDYRLDCLPKLTQLVVLEETTPNLAYLGHVKKIIFDDDLSILDESRKAYLSQNFSHLTSLTDLAPGHLRLERSSLLALTTLTRLDMTYSDEILAPEDRTFLSQMRAISIPNHLPELSTWTNLTCLDIIKDSLLQPADLRGLTNLIHLSVGPHQKYAEVLLDLPLLTSLNLFDPEFPEIVLNALTQLKRLGFLSQLPTKIQHIDGINQLCHVAIFGESPITVTRLLELPYLTSLELTGSTAISDQELLQLTKLQYLTLVHNPQISDISISHLANLRYLKIVAWNQKNDDNDLSQPLERVTLQSLMHLTKLETLILPFPPSEDTTRYFRQFRQSVKLFEEFFVEGGSFDMSPFQNEQEYYHQAEELIYLADPSTTN